MKGNGAKERENCSIKRKQQQRNSKAGKTRDKTSFFFNIFKQVKPSIIEKKTKKKLSHLQSKKEMY